MKRMILTAVSVAVLAAVMLLSACQSTPEADIVVNKGDQAIESHFKEEKITTPEPVTTGQDTADEAYTADVANVADAVGPEPTEPFHYTDSFGGTDREVTVVIDADVVPFTEPVSISETIPHSITAEEVREWTEVLFLGNKAYEYDNSKTREELEQLIADSQASLENLDPSMDPEYYQMKKENFERAISIYENMLADASDYYELKEAEWTFRSAQEYSRFVDTSGSEPDQDNQEIKVTCDMDGKTAYAECQTYTGEDFIFNSYNFWIHNGYQEEPLRENEEEAMQYVNGILEQMGLSDKWVIKSCSLKSQEANDKKTEHFSAAGYYYEMELLPCYGNIEVLSQEQIYSSPEIAEYSFRYYYESLRIQYSGGRIVYLYYMAPLDEVSVAVGGEVMGFDAAMQRFQEQMQLQTTLSRYTNGNDAGIPTEVTVNITRIEAGLVRVRIRDSEARYYMMPVWSFRGSVVRDEDEGASITSSGETLEPPEITSSILTINAIDGSIIDLTQGY